MIGIYYEEAQCRECQVESLGSTVEPCDVLWYSVILCYTLRYSEILFRTSANFAKLYGSIYGSNISNVSTLLWRSGSEVIGVWWTSEMESKRRIRICKEAFEPMAICSSGVSNEWTAYLRRRAFWIRKERCLSYYRAILSPNGDQQASTTSGDFHSKLSLQTPYSLFLTWA